MRVNTGIHTFCLIQTRRHTDTSSHENELKHKSCHTSSYYACSSSNLVGFCFCFWCSRALCPVVLHMLFLMPRGFYTQWSYTFLFLLFVSDASGLYTWWSYTCSSLLFLMPRGFIPGGLTLALPRYLSTLVLRSMSTISFHAHTHHIPYSSWSCYHTYALF
jgi:hypothetical protein